MKYEVLLNTSKEIRFGYSYTGIIYRIRALRDFSDVKAGDLGGWIESEKNLSQTGNCWIYDDAVAMEDAEVKDDATVGSHAVVSGNAEITGRAVVGGDVVVSGNAKVGGHSLVGGRAYVKG